MKKRSILLVMVAVCLMAASCKKNVNYGRDDNGDNWMGSKDPLITIEQFSDYQCPYCRKSHEGAKDLVSRHSDVRVVFRHFPLDRACNPIIKGNFHSHACKFAQAAECAGEQGKFWEMSDSLFEEQSTKASKVDLEQLADKVGADLALFKKCLEAPLPESVNANLNKGIKLGVTGTPIFVIDGKKYTGSVPDKVIKAALAEKN